MESIALAPDKKRIYIASKEHIRMYELGQPQAKILDLHLHGYFLSMQLNEDKLWASNAQSIFLYNTSGKRESTWDLSPYGRYIFDISLDKQKTVWFTQEASVGLKSIDKNGKVHLYGEKYGLNEELTIVRMGDKGIYAGSNNMSSYLYYKGYEDSVFVNISKPVNFPVTGDLRIEDIVVDGEAIWLASSVGILKQTNEGLQKISLDKKFDNLLVKTIALQNESPFIWFSTAYGLVQYNKETGEHNVYDESHGLPSNSVNARGLIVENNGIWAGTASGLAYSDYNFLNLKRTPSPFIVLFQVDNKLYRIPSLSNTELPSNPYIEMVISAPSYPGNKLRYQYKLDDDEETWKDVPSGDMLTFSKLNSGVYNISIRAKKFGNYSWSNPTMVQFKVEKAIYETLYFKLAIFLAAIALIFITRYITIRFLKKRQQILEKLVTERTTELARANEDLIARNQELDQFVYSTSHDLSAPLKSIRGLINIANIESDADQQKTLLSRMNDSVIKLEKFIKDVISYSRNARLDIKKEPIQIKRMVEDILENISNLEHFKKIRFVVDMDDKTIYSDETRVKIILNNLISNAVKFQRIGEEPNPQVTISYGFEGGRHKIIVKDNGQGISKEFTGKIFSMFFRANVSSDGSGLGLYILQETVNKLGGEVFVKSEEGVGSEFTVRFP